MKKNSFILFFVLICIIPLNVFAKDIDINSQKALLVNLNEDKFLYKKDINSKTKIASITKIMTAIVVIENIDDLNKEVMLTNEDYTKSISKELQTSGLKTNKYYSYEELLYGLILPSGADCANALVRNIAKNEDDFVMLMNKKALELGMLNTHFTNATGLDEKDNYSTVKDVYLMYKYAIQNELLKKILETREIKIDNIKLTHTIDYYLNKYNIKMDYLDGGKTGTETLAGYCLATTASYNNVNYMLITLNAFYDYNIPYHFYDAKTIYDYYMENYSYQTIINKNDLILSLKTKDVKEDSLNIYATNSYNYYLENNYDPNKINYVYEGINNIDYTFKKNTKLGNLKIYYDEELLDTIEITLNKKLHYSIISFYKENNIALYTLTFLCLIVILLYLKKTDNKEEKFNF